MDVSWNPDKNAWLQQHRGVCFEEVLLLIETERVLEVVQSNNQGAYPGQKSLVVEIRGYIYLVPFVLSDQGLFLKTIIPSRKATKKYGEGHGKKTH